MAAERQFDRMVANLVGCMKQRSVTELLLAEKIAPTNIH